MMILLDNDKAPTKKKREIKKQEIISLVIEDMEYNLINDKWFLFDWNEDNRIIGTGTGVIKHRYNESYEGHHYQCSDEVQILLNHIMELMET